jgi:hypothetical protein
MAVSGLILFASLRGFCAGFDTDASTESVTTNADAFQFSTHSFSNSFSTLLGNGYLFGATPWNGTSASERLSQDSTISSRKMLTLIKL